MKPDLSPVARLLLENRTFVITTHVNPDGDGLGSEMALARALIGLGKEVSVINHSPTPAVYRWLDPELMIRAFDKKRDAPLLAAAEVILVVDTNQPDRTRSMEQDLLASRAKKICIDHHLEPRPFADEYLIDAEATSTGEIIFLLIERLNGGHFTADVAAALYCAIMTDTGSFRYPRVDAETHRMIARLIEAGADPVSIYTNIYEQWSNGRIRLLGMMLAGLGTSYGGALAHVTVTRAMLAETGTTEEDIDNFTTYPMSVSGVKAAILFLELPGEIKMSFRSRGDIAINELAKEFGGNGHKNAAGARITGGSIDAARQQVIACAEKYLKDHSGKKP